MSGQTCHRAWLLLLIANLWLHTANPVVAHQRAGDSLREKKLKINEVVSSAARSQFKTDLHSTSDPAYVTQEEPDCLYFSSVDISGIQGITLDILQNYQALIEFHELPGDTEAVEVRLLGKGQHSVHASRKPSVHYEVTSPESGPHIVIRVVMGTGDDDDSPVLVSLLALTTALLSTWLLSSWHLGRKQKYTDEVLLKDEEEEDEEDGVDVLHETTGRQTVSEMAMHSAQELMSPVTWDHQKVALHGDDSQGDSLNKMDFLFSKEEQTLHCPTPGARMKAGLRSRDLAPDGGRPAEIADSSPQGESGPRMKASCHLLLQPSKHRAVHPISTSTLPFRSLTLCQGHCRRMLLMSVILVTLAAAATVGMTSLKDEQILQIGVPSTRLIRKVRMFSKSPDLSDIAQNTESLALVSKLQLMDLNNCHGNLSNCETVAVCNRGDNDFLCRCRWGYFFKNRKCQECRTSCAEGHYLVTPCTASSDAVCKPCTVCSGSQYEAAVCTTSRDTICVDVTFPVGILELNKTLGRDDGATVLITHSNNIFMERLVDMKELETPMYVTNNQQSMDFVWHRESGIDIVIRVSGVFLVPEYRELDALDDSVFFLRKKTEEQRMQELFLMTQNEYCRHPVPDYYHLHLHVIKNRTAAAQVVRCDSRDSSVPRCPKSYKDGDRYLKWDINTKCEKFSEYLSQVSGSPDTLSPLTDVANAVMCVEETSLDTKVFHQSRPVTLELIFPSPECMVYQQECERCMSSLECTNTNASLPRSCCGLHCYTRGACHQAYSPTCPPRTVECASGEVHEFSLQPVFSTMSDKFVCHLAYHHPQYLYNVSYSILIPSVGFQLPVQNYTASFKSLNQHHTHSDMFDFIQVMHDTRLPLAESLILVGDHKELKNTKNSHMQPFSIHALKDHAEFSRRWSSSLSNKENTDFSVGVQFERPFAYSSTSWYMSKCDKNISQIFPNQTVYKPDGTQVMGRRVDDEGDYRYQMYHADKSPYIKLSIAEAEPVLRWFQGKATHGVIEGGELSGQLMWNQTRQAWTITISGAVRDCPAVFTIQVFNKMMSQCIAVYDVLVTCPNQFNLTLGLSEINEDLPDIFVVLLNDSVSAYHLVLSSLIPPVTLPVTSSSPTGKSSLMSEQGMMHWVPVFAVVVLTGLSLISIFGIYLFIKFKSAAAAMDMVPADTQSELPTLNNQPSSTTHRSQQDVKREKSTATRICVSIFVVLYIVYSLVFTFSVGLVTLYFTHYSLLANISSTANFSTKLQKEMNNLFEKVGHHETVEEMRLFRSVESRLQACSQHMQEQNGRFLVSYRRGMTELLAEIYQKGGAIEDAARESLIQNNSIYTQQIEQFLLDCNRTVQSIIERFDAQLMIYVKDIARNGWFDFPREVFLTLEGDNPDKAYMSPNQLARFLQQLEVDKTDELLSVADAMGSRLSSLQVPSPVQYLHQNLELSPPDFVVSFPEEPMVATHTFVVLDTPSASSSHPFFESSSGSFANGPQLAFVEGLDAKSEVYPNGTLPLENEDDEVKSSDELDVMVYVLIGLFLLSDVLLFIYRMSWMMAQVHASKEGYEDRIPTDIVSQRILAIQTGYDLNRMQEMYEPYSYYLENKENMMASEEKGSESEYNTYFCQSYPKSKDDILREIMTQKIMNSVQPAEDTVGVNKGKTSRGVCDFVIVQESISCCRWIMRTFMLHFVWRFAVTAVVVMLLCFVAYVVDFCLTIDVLQAVVGGQSAVQDFVLQVHITNMHLAELASHLTEVLEEQMRAADVEITMLSELLMSTLATQREMLSSLVEQICQDAGGQACNTHLHLPDLPSWLACRVLPVEAHFYQDLTAEQLQDVVVQELQPLLKTVKESLLYCVAIITGALCMTTLCHAAATVVRYYMIVWGKLPRVRIYQISENTSLLYDCTSGHNGQMQRSASWLESCESGVYVGENEETQREV